jgi:hypothetical protein
MGKTARDNVRKWTSITPQFHVVSARYNFRGLALQDIKMHFEKIRTLEERSQIPVLLGTKQMIHIYIYLYTYKTYLLSFSLESSVFVFV